MPIPDEKKGEFMVFQGDPAAKTEVFDGPSMGLKVGFGGMNTAVETHPPVP